VPLYATDWTTDVEGDARVKVAQVVQAHQDELSACAAEMHSARVHVTFRWEGGKPVGIEATGAPGIEDCVAAEIASWRAVVADPGPYSWELVVPTGAEPRPIPTLPRKREIPLAFGGMQVGERLLGVAVLQGDTGLIGAVLELELTECVAGAADGSVRITFTPVRGQLDDGFPGEDGTLSPKATRCLKDAIEGLPYGGEGPVLLEFEVGPWRL
jgi:hypothetical protein